MSRKKPNKFIIAAAVLAGILLIILAAFRWQTNCAKTEVLSYTASDGTHKLIIYMIGDPDWPFGSTHCRFDLYEGNKRIVKYSFNIADDGANARDDNFTITEDSGGITVAVYGSEQGTETYILNYDGTVEFVINAH